MENKKEVCLISEYSYFSGVVAEILINDFYRVHTFSENVHSWEQKALNLKNSPNFQAEHIDELPQFGLQNFLYIDSLIFKKEKGELLTKLINLLKKSKQDKDIRGYLVFDIKGSLEKSPQYLKKYGRNIKNIYIDDIFGPEIVEKGVSIPSDLIIDAVSRKKIVLPKEDFVFRPSYSGTIAKEVVRQFSHGFETRERTLLGKEMPLSHFSFYLARSLPDCQVVVGEYRLKPSTYPKEYFEFEEKETEAKLDITLKWYLNNSGTFIRPSVEKKIRKKQIDFKKIRKKIAEKLDKLSKSLSFGLAWVRKKIKISYPREGFSRILKVFATSILLTVLPLLLLMFSVFLVLIAQEGIVRGNRSFANKALKSGLSLASLSENVFSAGSKSFFFPREFSYLKNVAEDIKHVANLGSTLTDVSLKTLTLSKKILGDREYSLSDYSKAIAVDLDKLYRQASFFEGDVKNQPVWHFQETAGLLTKLDLKKKREKVVYLKQLVENLPEILAAKGEKNYLLLFQNNMELRPTGGFIGSFAVVKFKQGRLADLNVMDVYAADGQLRGHVEPPWPIKNYLNQANWYLRDSNWDPDFPTSAQRAEWFVDKEVDIEVDGVVAVDLDFVHDVISAIGPLKIKDYDQEINEKNFYEIIQYEAEKDFFPGSQKKDSFLTALSRELILEFSRGKKKNFLELASAFYSSLERGHIQIFLHDEKTQQTIKDLGWSGEIIKPQCLLTNCYSDWAGIVEANLGVNKANYFVERTTNLFSYVDGRILKRRLELNLKSKANPAVGHKGTYFAYVRLLTPANSEFEEVKIISKGKTETVRPEIEYIKDRAEAGVYVEVLPSTGVNLIFSWKTWINLDFGQPGQYLFYLRKQPGTKADQAKLEINLPKGLNLTVKPDPWLISTGMVGYNLSLSESAKIETNW